MIPNVAHFVFGFKEQTEPFHPLHYASIESCRRVLAPERIYFHHHHLPHGPWWDRIESHLTLVEVRPAEEVLVADYSSGKVPDDYRYAHHADFVRLDALIEHGGVYADIDTVFLRPFEADLYEAPFVIGREGEVLNESTGLREPSLCNALLMSEPGSEFATVWRREMAGGLDGTWSNHSGFLSQRLSVERPDTVRVVPMSTFFPFGHDREGMADLLERRVPMPDDALSVHLWAHLWWERERADFSWVHAGLCAPSVLRHVDTTLANVTRPLFEDPDAGPGRRWTYLGFDERSGYGEASARCRAALETAGRPIDWVPFVRGRVLGLAYQPAFAERAAPEPGSPVVAHLVPEYVPTVRASHPDALLVAHTVWETDRLPRHWPESLDLADLVVVPSQFCAAVFAADLTTPVAVVPHAAPDIDAFGDDRWLEVDGEAVVFYTIAEWTERKAVWLTVEAFLRAFSSGDRVTLVIKTSPRDWRRHPSASASGFGPGGSAYALAQVLAGRAAVPDIRLVTRPLTDAEVTGLHRRGGCFVSLSRGEGWGLGAFDAAAFGNPVITTGWGGPLEFLGDSSLLVDHALVPVSDHGESSYTPDQRWAEPDVDHAARLLRAVYSDLTGYQRRAAQEAERIRHDFRPAAVAAAMESAVAGVRPGTPTP